MKFKNLKENKLKKKQDNNLELNENLKKDLSSSLLLDQIEDIYSRMNLSKFEV